MTGKTHVAIGMAVGLSVSFEQSLESQLILVLASIVGSLIPDLDHPKGKLNQRLLLFNNNFYRSLFYLSLGILFIYLYFLQNNIIFMLLGLVSFLIGISTHRGFTHSIVGFLGSASIVRLSTVGYGLNLLYYGFITGYILHLIGDFFTPRGIQLFYPIKTNVSFPITIKGNGKFEKILFKLLSIYSVCLLLKYLII